MVPPPGRRRTELLMSLNFLIVLASAWSSDPSPVFTSIRPQQLNFAVWSPVILKSRPTATPTATPTVTPTTAPTATSTITSTPSTATPTTTPTLIPEVPVLVGAGDIADCALPNDEATAALLDTIAGTVFTVGDNVYRYGSLDLFQTCYEPSWGRHKARTRPSAGNHDYGGRTRGLDYYAYFGDAAGPVGLGYYSYELGDWHIIVLNSNCYRTSCAAGSPQEQWLRADLAMHPAACTLAYWHHPRFASGQNGNSMDVQPFWLALFEAGADLVINGHEHHYERFAPQDAQGQPDAAGIREIIVGTGGTSLSRMARIQPNSELRENSTHGVLKLTLHTTSYDWEFVPIVGGTFTDAGHGECH
jgi:hypothetical protein